MRDWGHNTSVMRTLEEARKVLLGKSGRVPERCIMEVVATEECARCEGSGNVCRTYGEHSYNYPCRDCHESGEVVTKRRRVGLGVFERKLAGHTYIYETPEGCIEMRLHNTVIARWTPWWCEVFCGDWPTRFTRDRLNQFTPANIWNAYPIWMHWDGPQIPDGLPRFRIDSNDGHDYHSWRDAESGRWCYDSREIDPGPFGENCWVVFTDTLYKPRDAIIFFDGMKLNEEGYCMNPPILSEQRLLMRCVDNPAMHVRKWARRLLRAARAGELDVCDQCRELLTDALPIDGPGLDEARRHIVRHVMCDELVPIPLLVRYMADNGKGNVHDFARFVDNHVTNYLVERLKGRLTYNKRGDRGWGHAR